MSFKQFFLTEEKEVPKDTSKEPSPVKGLLKKAGKIDLTPLKKGGEIMFQWMRSKEGNQKFGNQEVIFRVTPETFEKYILTSDRKESIPLIKKAKSFEEMMNVIHSKIPNGFVYMKVFKTMNRPNKWKTPSSNESPLATEDDLQMFSNDKVKWVIQVPSFNTSEGQLWGSTADSDVYKNNDFTDKTLKNDL